MKYACKSKKGFDKKLILSISKIKNEPGWITKFRLKSFDFFNSKQMPDWSLDLSKLKMDQICFYAKPVEQKLSWSEIPKKIKDTYEKLGIIKAEQEILAGINAQFESEVIYKSLKKKWKKLGVIFCDIETAILKYPELIKKYFASVVKIDDNKFASLNGAFFSGGSFVYIPKNVQLTEPIQAYFRLNNSGMGQFERTLIIADEGSFVHYVEGCSAPIYRISSLHSAVVEIIALKNSHVQYTTIQNWSDNVYNLVTKRAFAFENAKVEWIDGNFGSKVTMKYPSVILKEKGAKAQIVSVSVANKNQEHDSGGKVIHQAANTSSNIISKSVTFAGGKSTFRGGVKIEKGACQVKSKIQCDALILDELSSSLSFPKIEVSEKNVDIGHEASISKIDEEQLFYLSCRGLNNQQANAMIINGFIDCFVNLLPMEYAVEINRLISMHMENNNEE